MQYDEIFRDALEGMDALVLIKGPASRLIWGNRAFRAYYGLSPEALAALIDGPHSDPDDTVQYVRDDHQVFTTGQPLRIVEPVVRHDGEVGYFATVKTAIRDQAGTIVGTLSISRPVGEDPDKRAVADSVDLRAARKIALHILRNLVSGSPAPKVVLDVHQRCVAVSRSFEALVGVALPPGASYQELVEQILPVDAVVRRVFAGETEVAVECDLSATGRIVALTARPWELPGHEVGGVLVQAIDLTEIRASEGRLRRANAEIVSAKTALEAQHAELGELLDSVSFGVVVADKQGRLARFNKEATRLLARGRVDGPAPDWVPAYRLLAPNGSPLAASRIPLERARHGEVVRDEIIGIGDGAGEALRWISCSATPLTASQTHAAVVAFHDVSALLKTQRELEEFAYVASHDLKEPLRMVHGFVGLLRDEYGHLFPAEAHEYMAYAVDGAERMRQLIDDLLTVSRTSSRPLEPAVVDLAEVLDEVRQSMAGLLDEKAGELRAGPLPVVTGDRSLLGALLQNLVANGLKFASADRPPRIEICHVPLAGFDRIEVRDNGIGIAPAFFERIFLMFQRLHPRSAYPGTGIGLAHCKRIVERHGGTIGVHSTPGTGATFWFTLARKDSH